MVKDMDIETIEAFYATILENTQTGDMAVFTKPYQSFVKEIKDLQDIL